jgi:hypothetical protein
MVVNLLRDAERCCLQSNAGHLSDYISDLSDDVSIV